MRLLSIALGIALASTSARASAENPCDAVVLYRSGSEAYQDAVEGIREALAGAAFLVEYVDQAASARRSCLDGTPKLVAALGIGAWESLGESPRALSVLPAMILHGDLRADLKMDSKRRQEAVYADVPLTAIVEKLRAAFPGKSRLALIHRPSRVVPDAAVIARVKQMGFELRVVDCAGPEKLLEVFSSLKGKVDFVITEPDSDLYNSATLKPLVFASLDQRLPIVGFSAAFVRAGALTGIYPDFHELGHQTGEAVIRILAGKGQHGEEGPRKVVIAVNERIARLIGVEPADRKGVVTFK